MLELVSYSDSEEDEHEEENIFCKNKETFENSSAKSESKKRKITSKAEDVCMKKQLPLPSSVQSMFKEKNNKEKYTCSKHQGRIRSFEHFEGNWPSHIFIPVQSTSHLCQFHEDIINFLRDTFDNDLHIFPLQDCHISLSRTVPVRHYWIEPLFTELKKQTENIHQYFFSATNLKVYKNDEKTRTFIGLEISNGSENFLPIVQKIDQIFEGFGLEKYYESPSFHFSIAWFLNDRYDEIQSYLKQHEKKIQVMLDGGIHHICATKACLKTGNKIHQVCFK